MVKFYYSITRCLKRVACSILQPVDASRGAEGGVIGVIFTHLMLINKNLPPGLQSAHPRRLMLILFLAPHETGVGS
jgi:hypothetical protein